MRFFSTIGVLFYTLVLSLVGGIIIGFSLHLIQLEDIMGILNPVYSDLNLRIVVGLTGLLLIFISISFAQLILGKIQKEKTIAFNNPSGQVSVSLSAVEDLVRRLALGLNECKDVRPDVIVNKKGIQIDLRIILRSETNIPDLTLRLQELIKSKVQEILGVEEEINVRIHISKIITKEEKRQPKEESPEIEEHPPSVPFQGYGRKR
ncbi:MAG: alkaline shock response membrane anchor protein AmaP [Candidatus Omnitrophica bacterium]|nr:alkaline shock response membrane anchor protein AmaP [Candidatus Omnitrophota bacterium]